MEVQGDGFVTVATSPEKMRKLPRAFCFAFSKPVCRYIYENLLGNTKVKKQSCRTINWTGRQTSPLPSHPLPTHSCIGAARGFSSAWRDSASSDLVKLSSRSSKVILRQHQGQEALSPCHCPAGANSLISIRRCSLTNSTPCWVRMLGCEHTNTTAVYVYLTICLYIFSRIITFGF